jgi:ABC-2 type transport system permease protein
MKRYLRLYKRYFQYSLMKQMEFRADFYITLLHLFIFIFFNVAFYRMVLSNAKSIAGWTYPEMIVLIGTFMILDSLFFTFFLGNFGNFDLLIRRAEMDRVLTKPVDAQFVSTLQHVDLKEAPSFFMGIAVVCYGLWKLQITPDLLTVISYAFFCLVSLSITYSIGLMLSCIGFYFEKAEDLHELLISFWQFAKFPDIYRGLIKGIFMVMMPVVFASYVPAGLFFGKVPTSFIAYYFVISIILFYISRKFWKISLRRYKSAGG